MGDLDHRVSSSGSWHRELIGEDEKAFTVVGAMMHDLLILGRVIPSARCLFGRKFHHNGHAGCLAFDDFAFSIQQSPDGGYLVLGQTESFGAGDMDVYLFKTDSSGNLLWEETFGGMHADGGYDLLPTGNGGYVFAGYTGSFGAGNQDMYLVTLCAPTTSGDPFTRGDSNIDGRVDISDVLTTLVHLFLEDTLLVSGDAADANDDGRVNIDGQDGLFDGRDCHANPIRLSVCRFSVSSTANTTRQMVIMAALLPI